jgi:hypothetical protein
MFINVQTIKHSSVLSITILNVVIYYYVQIVSDFDSDNYLKIDSEVTSIDDNEIKGDIISNNIIIPIILHLPKNLFKIF